MNGEEFRKMLYVWYRTNGRGTLPWRKTEDAYKIFISELMLQQTQAERVVPKYEAFIKKFPTVKILAKAEVSAVLKLWQGLGYNRRALFAKRAAEAVMKEHKGIFPKEVETLEKLPGIGPYTARAIVAFAYNQSNAFIETNIRTVIIHHFFSKKKKVTDIEITKVVARVLDSKNPRKFYSAMMDYGSYLKKEGVQTHRKSHAYKKQSAFKGSFRQIRGILVREYTKGGYTSVAKLLRNQKENKPEYKAALAALLKEGIISKK